MVLLFIVMISVSTIPSTEAHQIASLPNEEIKNFIGSASNSCVLESLRNTWTAQFTMDLITHWFFCLSETANEQGGSPGTVYLLYMINK